MSDASANGFLNVNVHFVPQWSLCPFCDLDFEFIGKVEDFETESNFVIQHLNLQVLLLTINDSPRFSNGLCLSNKNIDVVFYEVKNC